MQHLRVIVLNLFSILSFSSIVCAQPILMTTEAGNFDNGRDISVDKKGNIYVTGSFLSDTLLLDSVILRTNGNQDVFLIKYDPQGKVIWAKSFGGIGDEKGLAIAIDGDENIFIAGCFSASFKSDTATIKNHGQYDVFLAKYDSAGSLLWIKSGGGNGDDYGQDVSVDAKGNIYLAGSFSSADFTLNNTSFNNASNKVGSMDIFFAKYDNSGRLLWAKSVGGKLDDGCLSISTDASNHIYIAGYFTSPDIAFGNTILKNTFSKKGSYDMYLAKYNEDGEVLWAKSFGGKYDDAILGVCNDKKGNAYVTGYFDETEGISLDTVMMRSNGGLDIFLIKYNAYGKVVWAKNIGGLNDESGINICADRNGNILLTGYFESDEISFGSTSYSTKNKSDIFLAKYDSLGNNIWSNHSGGASDEAGLGVGSAANGDIVITGYFESGILPFESAVLTKKSVTDVFVAKYNSEGKNLWAKNSYGKGGFHRQKIESAATDNTLIGRILFNKKMKEGVAGAKVVLLNNKGKVIKSTTADDYGIFIFKNVADASNTAVKITGNAYQFFNQKKIYLANIDNTIVGVAKKEKSDFFVFENLNSEWKTLPPLIEKDSVAKIAFSGNMYAGEERMPVKKLKVYLLNAKGEIVQSSITDSFGSFMFANVLQGGKYTIQIDSMDKRISSSVIYYTNKKGIVIASGGGRVFKYEILPTDRSAIAQLQVKDAELLADVRGKLCSDNNGKKPIAGCKVQMINAKGEEVGKAFTDSLGNFWITGVTANEYYIMKLEENGSVIKMNEIFVADANGKVIGKLKSGEGKFFRFEILPMEEQSLSKIYFEDINPNSLFDGKLLFNPKTGQGIPDTKISLLNPDGTILQTVMTDDKGMFLFKHLPIGQNFNVKVYENNDVFINQDKIYLADKTNRVVSKVVKSAKGFFVFENLPPQLNKLSDIIEKDTAIQMSFSGNLYVGENRMPIGNLRVNLLYEKGQAVQTVLTNSFGSFTFSNVLSEGKHTVILDTTDKRIISAKVYFTNKQGVMVASMDGRLFRFELLPADENTLSLLQVKDAELLADIRGKICSDTNGNSPVAKCVVKVVNVRGEEIGKALTDSLGNFWITGVAANEYYLLKLEESENVLKPSEIFIADTSGKLIGKLKSSEGKFFRFELFPVDKQSLTNIYVDDPWLKVAKLQAEVRKDSMFIIENIYYEYQKWNLSPSALITLNKVVEVMRQNPDISMEVISHTDSRGADDFNLLLSQKRSASVVSYIVSKGINKKRIIGIGKGESQLLNKCDDGVDCTEEEHAKNRRTEFKITRNMKKSENKIK